MVARKRKGSMCRRVQDKIVRGWGAAKEWRLTRAQKSHCDECGECTRVRAAAGDATLTWGELRRTALGGHGMDDPEADLADLLLTRITLGIRLFAAGAPPAVVRAQLLLLHVAVRKVCLTTADPYAVLKKLPATLFHAARRGVSKKRQEAWLRRWLQDFHSST